MQIYKNVFDYSSDTIEPSIDNDLFVANSKRHNSNNSNDYMPPVDRRSSSNYYTDARAVDGYGGYPGSSISDWGDTSGDGGMQGKLKDKKDKKDKAEYHKSTTYKKHYKKRKNREIIVIPPRVSCKVDIVAMYSPNIVVLSLNVSVKSGTDVNFNPRFVALIDYGDGSRQTVYFKQYRTLYVGHHYINSGKYNINVYLHTGYSNVKSQCSTFVNFNGEVLPKGIIPIEDRRIECYTGAKKSSFVRYMDGDEIIYGSNSFYVLDGTGNLICIQNSNEFIYDCNSP